MHFRLHALIGCFLTATWAGAIAIEAQEPSVQITFLDVGQGDAIVIRSPEGQIAMIDAGRGGPLRYLQQMGVDEIDLLVSTHPHADHIGGMVDVLTARPVRFYMDNGQPHTTATYERLMAVLLRLDDVTYLEAIPRNIDLGSVSLEVLPLLPPDGVDHNNRSVALVLRFGKFTAFLSGDSEVRELTDFVRQGVVPDVTLLKAPHHGSVNGFTRAFLEAARPEVVVISVGADNPYLHPRPEALAAYGSVAEHILRTDRDGHVTILGYADGRYEVVLGQEVVTGGIDRAGSLPEGQPADREGAHSDLISVTVVADAPGNDHENLNGEYVVIQSQADVVLDIGRWQVCDLSSRCFRFPDDARIEPGRRVVVYTGYGMNDGVSFFMNNSRAVWNNDGDEATIFDARGRPVLRYVYE